MTSTSFSTRRSGTTTCRGDSEPAEASEERLIGHVGAWVDDGDRRLATLEPAAQPEGRVEAHVATAEDEDPVRFAVDLRGHVMVSENFHKEIPES
jgi:hypothetical protein